MSKQEEILSLKEELRDKKENLLSLQEDLKNFELDPDDFVDQYDEMLDEISTVKIGSLEYSGSFVLKNVDETAYRCGLNDYIDSLNKEDSELYQEIEINIGMVEDEISDIEGRIEALEESEED